MESELKRFPEGLRVKPNDFHGYQILDKALTEDNSINGLLVRLFLPIGAVDVVDPEGDLTLKLEDYFFGNIDDFVEKQLKSIGVEIEHSEEV